LVIVALNAKEDNSDPSPPPSPPPLLPSFVLQYNTNLKNIDGLLILAYLYIYYAFT
jgi:hypothetical protein